MDDPQMQPMWGEQLFPRKELRLHLREPDFTRPKFEMTSEQRANIKEKLEVLYGREGMEACFAEVERLMQVHYAYKTPEMIEDEKTFNPSDRFTERDIVVITYGDHVRRPGVHPLKGLAKLLSITLGGFINTVHILPFFPYSSDRGFSVIDFTEVDPRLGSWKDIVEMSLSFRLMIDGVINHVSAKSNYFREFLNGNPDNQDYFIAFNTKDAVSDDNLRLILRPRTSDLLTPFQTLNGVKYVWTTFSPDQVDLNYKNPKTLMKVLDLLLFYVRRGVDIIRLDAATYLWWELGTSSAHLLETHTLVQLFRAVFDAVAPKVGLITETNVPHEDNVSYFGDGTNEAHMVYNFGLPPLVLHTMQTGNCRALSEWAENLGNSSDTCTYFNFLDSHDGIGLLGARGYLSEDEIEAMVSRTKAHGGLVSYRTSREGAKSPYELNITWFDALNDPNSSEPADIQVGRFIASRSIAFVLMGVPAIYIQSLTGSRLVEPVENSELDEPRSINRRAPSPERAVELLSDRSSIPYKILERFRDLGEIRNSSAQFHPNGPQTIIRINEGVFTVLRTSPDGSRTLLALTNVTNEVQQVRLAREQLGPAAENWKDLLSPETVCVENGAFSFKLEPYRVMWLEPC